MWRASERAVVFVTILMASGCGSDDAAGNGVGTYGTCDRKALVGGCIESTGSEQNIRNQKDGCDKAGGTWTTEPCPATDLIGCCEYTFGLEFRECWYTNSAAADPEASCATMEGSAWTPAP